MLAHAVLESQLVSVSYLVRAAHFMRWMDIAGMNSYAESMKAVVSERGQVTIPQRLRRRLGIRPGQVLDFEEEAGRLVVSKVGPADDPVTAVLGILNEPGSTDAWLNEIRGEPDTV
jgi:AbrB family looped-hinge helix DNA binding protein